uniref:Uncharacterized protein n=1 Tax=Lepeophtheirus salmonis TaxID=72036 RepID=A0A0K2TQK8_LEPSM
MDANMEAISLNIVSELKSRNFSQFVNNSK